MVLKATLKPSVRVPIIMRKKNKTHSSSTQLNLWYAREASRWRFPKQNPATSKCTFTSPHDESEEVGWCSSHRVVGCLDVRSGCWAHATPRHLFSSVRKNTELHFRNKVIWRPTSVGRRRRPCSSRRPFALPAFGRGSWDIGDYDNHSNLPLNKWDLYYCVTPILGTPYYG